jgi:hypothetical protein
MARHVNVDELTVDELRQYARSASQSDTLVRELAGNPATRNDLQRLLKKHNPNIVIPEIDAADAVRGEVAMANDRIAQLENVILEKDIRDRLTRQRGDVQAKYRLSEGDMGALEAMMTDPDPEKRVNGYETAARLYTAERQQAVPTPSALAPPGMKMPDTDVWGKSIGNRDVLNRTAIEQAYRATQEFRSGGLTH